MDQPKIERLLRLLKLMSGNIDYTISQLSSRLSMSERTIYRYIESFKDAGFAVVKKAPNLYKIQKISSHIQNFDDLVFFTEEESYIVNSLIDSIIPSTNSRKLLKNKLAVICDSTSISNYVDSKSNEMHIQRLSSAIKEKSQVKLIDYASSNSTSVRDRFVEPFSFSIDYLYISAFDLEDKKNKTFKIQRISEVELLDTKWEYEEMHKEFMMDIFRFTGQKPYHIKWAMTLNAKNLLIEEHPLAQKYISSSDIYEGFEYILETDICSFVGACRFYMGLANQIRIIDSPEFSEYVNSFICVNFSKQHKV